GAPGTAQSDGRAGPQEPAESHAPRREQVMITLLQIGLTNVVLAAILAVPAILVGRCCRRPALTHALWLLVFFKLLTPPLFTLPVSWLTDPPPLMARADITELIMASSAPAE